MFFFLLNLLNLATTSQNKEFLRFCPSVFYFSFYNISYLTDNLIIY